MRTYHNYFLSNPTTNDKQPTRESLNISFPESQPQPYLTILRSDFQQVLYQIPKLAEIVVFLMLFCNWKTFTVNLPYIDTLYYSRFRPLALHGYSPRAGRYIRQPVLRLYTAHPFVRARISEPFSVALEG